MGRGAPIFRYFAAGAMLLWLAGCATPPPAVHDWAHHPANPAAAESPPPATSQTLTISEASEETQGVEGDHQ